MTGVEVGGRLPFGGSGRRAGARAVALDPGDGGGVGQVRWTRRPGVLGSSADPAQCPGVGGLGLMARRRVGAGGVGVIGGGVGDRESPV